MQEVTINNIQRTLEEEVLQDYVNGAITLFVEGVDSAVDVDLMNSKFKFLDNKIKALTALMYLKESSILDKRRDDPIPGSIFFNREKNTLEFYNGQSWDSHIFSPNTVLDMRYYSLDDLGNNIKNGLDYATVSSIPLNNSYERDQVIVVVADGDILDQKSYYIDESDSKILRFITPITVLSNIMYYVLGSETSYSGTIPRYEIMEYVADGVRTIFPISANKDFMVSYKSSVEVLIDGIQLRDTEFTMNSTKNQVILKTPPKVGAYVEIKTLFGVTTDFRGSLTYVEQIQEAQVAKQRTFQYNGVSDAVKVYWNGLRLISGKDFKFNYVQKLVIMEDHITEQIEVGDTVIIEKEMAPMSKEPMQGVLVTESKVLVQGAVELDYPCNGVTTVIVTDPLEENPTPIILLQKDYFVSDKVLSVTNNEYQRYNIQVTYLTNAKLTTLNVPEIDDNNLQDVSKVWSGFKINKELNNKANNEGSLFQDFNTRDIHVSNDAIVDGNIGVKGDLNVTHTANAYNIKIGNPNSIKLETLDDSDTFLVNQNMMVKRDVTIVGNLRLEGKQIGNTLEEISVASNTITLNEGLETNQDPISESGIVVKRGNKGEASIKFVEAEKKWKFTSSEEPFGVNFSIDGHTHTLSDLVGTDIPMYKSLTSTKNTSEEFYTNDEYKEILEDKLSNEAPIKSMGRLVVSPSSVIGQEDAGDEVYSGNILSYERYQSIKTPEQNISTKHNVFSIIEDGSIYTDSQGCLVLPSGRANKRWESDTNFCGVPGSKFNTNLQELNNDDAWKSKNGLIRYNTDDNAVEMKIDKTWIKFRKPDVAKHKSLEVFYDRGRYITAFGAVDFTALRPEDISDTLGFQSGEYAFKVNHNLNCLYVRIDIFDDKRAAFPLLYKCVDENNAYIYFPSNIVELSGANDVISWLNFLANPLHRVKNAEGTGHMSRADTSKELPVDKKFVAIVTAL